MAYKEDMKFQKICLYEISKIAVSVWIISLDVWWYQIFHEV